ncbi:hypothetical protein DSECCO2_451170 [anaerobic digester metagenome]
MIEYFIQMRKIHRKRGTRKGIDNRDWVAMVMRQSPVDAPCTGRATLTKTAWAEMGFNLDTGT